MPVSIFPSSGSRLVVSETGTVRPHYEPRAPFLLFLLLALAYHWDLVAFGPWGLIRFFDIFDCEFMHYAVQAKALMEHGLTGWYPQYSGGISTFVGHRTPYYPLTLLSILLPPWAVYLFVRLLLTSLAGYGMYRLLRRHFQAAPLAALAGGFFLAVATPTTNTHFHFIFSYVFPLFFCWFLEMVETRQHPLIRLAKGLGLLGLSLLSYPVLTLPYFSALQLGLVLVFFRDSPRFKALVAGTFLLWTGYLLLFAPQIFALFDFLPFAQRTYLTSMGDGREALFKFVKEGGKLLWEDRALFPLFLLALPTVFSSRRTRLALICVAAPTLAYAFFTSPAKALLADTFFIKMDLGNVDCLLPITLSLFVALALDHWRTRPPHLLTILAVVGASVALGRMSSERVLLFQVMFLAVGLLFLALERTTNRRALAWAMTGLIFCLAMSAMMVRQQDSLNFAHLPYKKGFENHPELDTLAAESRANPFRVGCLDVSPTIPQSHGLELVGQKGVVFNRFYKDYFREIIAPQLEDPKHLKDFDTIFYYLYLGVSNVHRHMFLAPPPDRPRSVAELRLPLLLAANVRYLLSAEPVAGLEEYASETRFVPGQGAPDFLPLPQQIKDLYAQPFWLYRLKDSLDRAYEVRKTVVLGARQEVLAAMAKADVATFRSTVWFAAEDMVKPPESLFPAADKASAALARPPRITLYTPDRIVIEGETKAPGHLVVSNTFDPHWSARVNDLDTPLLRANHAFQAVALPSGPYQVVLEYAFPAVWMLHGSLILGALFHLLLPGPPGRTREPGPDGWRRIRPAAHEPGLTWTTPGSPEKGTPAPRPRLFLAALAASTLWTLNFYFFLYLRNVNGDERPWLFVLLTTPLTGLLVGAWASLVLGALGAKHRTRSPAPGQDQTRP